MLFSYLLVLAPEDCLFVSICPIPTYGKHCANNNCTHITLPLCENFYYMIITSADISPSLIRKCTRDPNFLSRMLVTDESCFTRNGITNYRNTHTLDDENPHTTATTHYQHTFSFKCLVWSSRRQFSRTLLFAT